jgi:hypothetical protein
MAYCVAVVEYFAAVGFEFFLVALPVVGGGHTPTPFFWSHPVLLPAASLALVGLARARCALAGGVVVSVMVSGSGLLWCFVFVFVVVCVYSRADCPRCPTPSDCRSDLTSPTFLCAGSLPAYLTG